MIGAGLPVSAKATTRQAPPLFSLSAKEADCYPDAPLAQSIKQVL